MSKSINRHGSSQAGIASAQARVTGDQETQSMLDLLARAKLAGGDSTAEFLLAQGPLTSPPQFDRVNIFENSYAQRSESPEEIIPLSPTQSRKPHGNNMDQESENAAIWPTSAAGQELNDLAGSEGRSDVLSRTTTNESHATGNYISPVPTRPGLQRTFTDTSPLKLQNTLIDAMVQPYPANDKYTNGKMLSPPLPQSAFNAPQQSPLFPPYLDQAPLANFPGSTPYGLSGPHPVGPVVHGHSSRWAPAAQAIFTTESKAPWTILAANDLACLVFGVTNAEVRRMGIMEVVREERRAWLEEKLAQPGSEAEHKSRQEAHAASQQNSPQSTTSFLLGRGGITASLLNKPSSRQVKESRRTQTDDGAGSSVAARKKAAKGGLNHASNKSRGVLLCGDVVPIQKRNGHTGSASLWVKEKKGGLIWVLEEIHEDVASIGLDGDGMVTKIDGSAAPIWGDSVAQAGVDIGTLIPRIPRQGIDPSTGEIDYAEVVNQHYFTAQNYNRAHVPVAIERVPGGMDLKVSSFPHIAGIVVLSADTLQITSANSVFSAALFGQEHPDRLHVTDLIPGFDRILKILTEDDGIRLVDGMVVPEHSFRRARAFAALRDGKADAAAYFLRPDGLPARHRDGSEIKIDVQMRVVKSDKHIQHDEHVIVEEDEDATPQSEVVYALWITYSRHLHGGQQVPGTTSPLMSGNSTPLHQPSPGQTQMSAPLEIDSSDEPAKEVSHASLLTKQLKEAARNTANKLVGRDLHAEKLAPQPPAEIVEPIVKKTINDFVILEEMGQGAYGQVKLARNKKTGNKVVLKFVTKRRILVDTWTRDRRLGTVPLEIHVLDYLRRNGLQHPNIVEMDDFFEDDVNYYIEMIPHGLPGMDLFDYIELRVNMEEAECRGIFVQVARAVHHLHTKANVVHRDIKDENVVLDGEGTIKLIDFGSAAYIKNGPFDVFVGTIGKPFLPKNFVMQD
jgi:protein-serine/threonine kinase